jgi:hypothetical protein
MGGTLGDCANSTHRTLNSFLRNVYLKIRVGGTASITPVRIALIPYRLIVAFSFRLSAGRTRGNRMLSAKRGGFAMCTP